MKWSHPEPGEDSKWPLLQQKPFVKHFSALFLFFSHSLSYKYTSSIQMLSLSLLHTQIDNHTHLPHSVSGCEFIAKADTFLSSVSLALSYLSFCSGLYVLIYVFFTTPLFRNLSCTDFLLFSSFTILSLMLMFYFHFSTALLRLLFSLPLSPLLASVLPPLPISTSLSFPLSLAHSLSMPVSSKVTGICSQTKTL